MQICVHLDAARLFRSHFALLAALAAERHEVAVSFGDEPEPLPNSFTALIDYDRARAKATSDRFSTLLRPEAFDAWPRYAGGSYDVMLDLSTASKVRTHPGRVLRPLYDGAFKDYALMHAILDQRAPVLAISDSISREHVWKIGLPAIETPWRPSFAMDTITSRLVEGFVRVVGRIAAGEAPSDDVGEANFSVDRVNIFSASTTFARKRASRKARQLSDMLTGNEAKWHVAWRKISPDAATSSHSEILDLSKFRILEDDGQRYFADPFVFIHEGTTHVFIEEFPKATGKGIISHFTLNDDGTPSPITVVLQTEIHLSYPYVFAHEGHIYMLPKSSAAGGLELYRAKRFPFEWQKVSRLIEGSFHDATPFQHEGRWWIAASTKSLQSSSWDGLSLFYADALTGPWKPHRLNPVFIDARAARPGGALWRDAAGRLIRPAQDCTGGYGSKLTLRAISTLKPGAFEEETIGVLEFGGQTGILGPHTLSRVGGFEVIDLFASPSALRAGYRR